MSVVEAAPIEDQWSDAERWVWTRIREGEIADFNARDREVDPAFEDLDPTDATGWSDNRRLSVSFLQTILTTKPFVEATPVKGVKILGALVDGGDALDFAYVRLERVFWLDKSRLLVDIELPNLRVDGEFSLEGNYVQGTISLGDARIDGNVFLAETSCGGDVDLSGARIGGRLDMSGSTFDGTLYMNGTEVGRDLFMREKATLKEVDLTAAKIGGQFDMSGSTFDGALNMNGTEVGQSLFMREKATFKEIDLTGAKIGGQLAMIGSTFDGTLTMDSTEVGQSLMMSEKATFKEVVLRGAKIGGQLAMIGSAFDGTLNMNRTEVGQSLLMREKATFREVVLRGAKIGGQLDMRGSTFDGTLTMDGTEVGESILARSTTFPADAEVGVVFATIGSNLDVSGATIKAIDLTGTTVKGELRLGSWHHPPANWVEPSKMFLRNTIVGAIQDADEDPWRWPLSLEMEGFRYGRLGGFGAEGPAAMGKRPSAWFEGWLKRDETYSPQPYEQLADVLRTSGYPIKADDVLYAGRKRARRQAREDRAWARWIGMWVLQLAIGYGLGLRYFRAGGWALLFTAVGMLVLMESLPADLLECSLCWNIEQRGFFSDVSSALKTAAPSQRPLTLLDLFWVSLDQILPIVSLDKANEKLIAVNWLPRWALYYFYLQKIAGWVLGSFLVAGLAGLTQKN